MSFLYYFLPGLLVGLVVDLAVRRLSGPSALSDAPEAGAPAGYTRAGAASSGPGHSARRRLALVLVSALVIGGVGLRHSDPAAAVVVAAYAAVLLTCTATDLISFRVPNAITYPAILLALVAAALVPEGDVAAAVAGGAIAGGFMLAAAILTRGGIGLGDVKLAAFVGLALGVPLVYPALLLMAILGGLVAAGLLLLRIRGKGDPLPYAPVLALAALIVLLWQGSSSLNI